VKPDADRIIITDDGAGFSKNEFEAHFHSVSESHKRDLTEITDRGRPKIGKIGIGFIAANEICDEMEIYSTKKGSSELLHVTIDFAEMRKPLEARRRGGNQLVKADYYGSVEMADSDSHYTQLFLKRVRGEARKMLVSPNRQQTEGAPLSLYGLRPESVSKFLTDVNTWDDFDFYSQTLLHVALNVPIKYFADWMPPSPRKTLSEFPSEVASLKFDLQYDGAELRKPIKFSDQRKSIVERFKFAGSLVSAKGYFFAQHGTIKPRELQGLLFGYKNNLAKIFAQLGKIDHRGKLSVL
jgi:hypothetical protein